MVPWMTGPISAHHGKVHIMGLPVLSEVGCGAARRRQRSDGADIAPRTSTWYLEAQRRRAAAWHTTMEAPPPSVHSTAGCPLTPDACRHVEAMQWIRKRPRGIDESATYHISRSVAGYRAKDNSAQDMQRARRGCLGESSAMGKSNPRYLKGILTF